MLSARGVRFFSLPAAHQLVRMHAGAVSEPSIFQPPRSTITRKSRQADKTILYRTHDRTGRESLVWERRYLTQTVT